MPISANPGASNSIPGTGLLGHLIGLDNIPGVRVGGLWIGNADYLVHRWSEAENLELQQPALSEPEHRRREARGHSRRSLDAELLQFNGEDSQRQGRGRHRIRRTVGPEAVRAHRTVRALVAAEPVRRQARDSSRQDQCRPTTSTTSHGRVPTQDTSLQIPAVTGLIYTPIFKNPTLIGASPGYYNSAYGITANFAPTRNFYLTYAFYDGALARGIQTGLREAPVFDGHYFTIGEAGYAWTSRRRTN